MAWTFGTSTLALLINAKTVRETSNASQTTRVTQPAPKNLNEGDRMLALTVKTFNEEVREFSSAAQGPLEAGTLSLRRRHR